MESKTMDTKIIDQLEAIFGEEFKLVQHDPGKMEQLVQQKMQLLGQGLLQWLVDNRTNGYQGSSIPCGCGGSMEFVQHRGKDAHTLFGWIKVKQAYYYCPDCGDSYVPYDIASGLGSGQLSPGLAKACCVLAVDDSFRQTSQKIEQLFGQKVSDNTIERVVQQVGTVAAKQQQQQLEGFLQRRQIPPAIVSPDRFYIAADGTTAHEVDGWHEVKIGSTYWQDGDFKSDKRYVACFDNSQVFGWYLWLESCKCGLRQAKEVVYLGDGAGWIRSEHESHFSRATFIIDWYHLEEHVWNCGKLLLGEGTGATARWAAKVLALLWDGWTKKVLDYLSRQRPKYRGGKGEAIDDLYHYISINEEQMRYDVFRSKGYQIGSGAAEGARKSVVGKRLKQSGMRWTRLGSSSVLALRLAWLNGRWEQLWAEKPLAA
jgi:hypothetical protein